MIELTEEQQREIAKAGWPPRAVNPLTREAFVLIPAEMFERVRSFLEVQDEIATVEEMAPLASEVIEADDTGSRESA